jgi:ATP-binding cassette subfamily B protein/ATP-binding cassette subfamily C protein/ATP-binding cassette subfamily B multidrug efflux pump
VLSLGYGGWLVWHGEISVGQLTSFGLYLGQLIWPMFAAGWVLALLERGRAAWERLQPVLAEPPAVDDHGTVAAVTPGALVAQGLTFHYPGDARGAQTAQVSHAALTQVGFTLAPGATLGIVGPTGSGKSTLLKLLMRQWTPQQGAITWGGVPLAEHTLAALRQAQAWVAQEPFLFSATVGENIALAQPDASNGRIEAVARLAAVHDDIARLPQGYDTPVGERGVTLSGGQRQRVAIARSLLVQAPLLLLDDALSAVDTETEAQILAALRAARQQSGTARSTVIVSHRLSTLLDADEILVLRHGRVTERGTHAELVALGGWYATQWHVQQLEASLAAADPEATHGPAA